MNHEQRRHHGNLLGAKDGDSRQNVKRSRSTPGGTAPPADGKADTFPGDLRSTITQGTFLILLL
eukprot:11031702-Heterocapsa_arctica.AAC.1